MRGSCRLGAQVSMIRHLVAEKNTPTPESSCARAGLIEIFYRNIILRITLVRNYQAEKGKSTSVLQTLHLQPGVNPPGLYGKKSIICIGGK